LEAIIKNKTAFIEKLYLAKAFRKVGLDKKVFFESFYLMLYKYNNERVVIKLKKKYDFFLKILQRFGFRLEKT